MMTADKDPGARPVQVMNKYERAIVAALEARRLNDITRVTGESLSARVTQMAIENVRSGKVGFFYEAPDPPAEEVAPRVDEEDGEE